MKNNLHSIFASPFYINPEYAQSLVPGLISAFVHGNVNGSESEIDMKNRIVSLSSSDNNVNNGAASVLVLDLKQPIQKFSDWYNLGTKGYMQILESYKNDSSIAGVVLDSDSGGGQVYGTPEFYDYLKSYPKPIVTYTDGYLCSAAYYIAAGTDYIIANKRADCIGSIGAYTTIVDFKGILEKFGAKVHTMYATKSTEKNAEYNEVIDNANYEPYVKNVLDPIVETFHADMLASRPQLDKSVFAGGTWGGEKSIVLGLIDEVGNLQMAINKVFELSNQNLNNLNNKSMNTKSLPKIEAVLGLESSLVVADNGSFINEEQLEALENRLNVLEASEAENQEKLNEVATALQTAKDTANAAATVCETAVNEMLINAGLTVEGSIEEKLTSLSVKVTEMGAGDGAAHTTVLKPAGATIKPDYVDASASHNQMANEYLK